MKMNIRKIMKENPLLAIMRNVPVEVTLDYVQAVVDGGVRFFEVALNSKEPLRQIRMMREHFKDEIYVGAGTATTVDRAKAAMEAGAQFLLSPSADEEVLAYSQSEEISLLPGVLTPSDVSRCVKYGFTTLKLFPAGDMPRGYIKSLKGPFDGTEYIAIGGVSCENIHEFFEDGYLGVGLGSNLIPKDVMAAGDLTRGSAYVAEMMSRIRGCTTVDK